MDYRRVNFILESTIVELQTGRLYEARQGLDGLMDEAIRFAVKPSERGHTATIARLTRAAADGGDWQARAAKAKMYGMAGAKKAGKRAHDQAHATTVNAPEYEATDTSNAGAPPAPGAAVAKSPGADAQRKKRIWQGVPGRDHGFVDPHDPEVMKRKAATAAYFDKWSSPRKEAKRYPVYKRVVKKESVDALKASLEFLKREDKP